MAKYDPLPETDHVVRKVSWTRLRRDEHGNVLGCLWQAFQLREDEKDLSSTWLEHFSSAIGCRLVQAVAAMRQSQMTLTKKTGLALAQVSKILKCGSDAGLKFRVIHMPESTNPGYAAILNTPRDDQELLEILAADAVVETLMVSALDAGLITPR